MACKVCWYTSIVVSFACDGSEANSASRSRTATSIVHSKVAGFSLRSGTPACICSRAPNIGEEHC